jgi:hypothetical protein
MCRVEEYFRFERSIHLVVGDIEPRNTILLLLVTSVSADFALLSFGSSLITGRPDEPSVSVFLLGSICTRMRLTSFLFFVEHWKHGKKVRNRKVY